MRCVKSDWIDSEECLPDADQKSCCGGGHEDKHTLNLQIITWNETISNQKVSWKDGSKTKRKLYPKSPPIPSNSAQIFQISFNLTIGASHFKWLLNSKQTMQKWQSFGAISVRISSLVFHSPSSELYEWTNVGNSEWRYGGQFRIQPQSWRSPKGFGRYHYWSFSYLYIVVTFYCFLFIIIFDVMDMLLPLYVLCYKIAIKKNLVYSQVSRDFARFPVFTVRTLGWKSESLCHITAHPTL